MENQIIEYLEKWWKVVQENGYRGIVLLFDEFHTVNDVKPNRWYMLTDFLWAINEIQSNGCRYSLVLCGLPAIMSNVRIARSYAERMFSVMSVSNLDGDAAKDAISKPLEGTPWSFSDDLVAAIVYDTDGYPYFIQFFCNEIISRVGKNHVYLDDYEKIKDQIIGDLGRDFFDQRIEPLSAAQKQVLYSTATLPDLDLEFSSIQKYLGMRKGPLSNHLKRLEEKGFIYKSKRGIYRFAIPLFRKYVLLKMQSRDGPQCKVPTLQIPCLSGFTLAVCSPPVSSLQIHVGNKWSMYGLYNKYPKTVSVQRRSPPPQSTRRDDRDDSEYWIL